MSGELIATNDPQVINLNGLSEYHFEILKESAINPEVILERHYRTVYMDDNGPKLLRSLAIPSWARDNPDCYPGLLIPLYRASGELISYQYRPDVLQEIEGKKRKYANPSGKANVIDVHPRNIERVRDPTTRLWITEGTKKGDALTSYGECAVSCSGVFNWRNRIGTLGDWEDIPLRDREVIICFDSDTYGNDKVSRAMARLGRWVKSKLAKRVLYIVVPYNVNGNGTKGVDDYLAAGGSILELVEIGEDKPPEINKLNLEFADTQLSATIAGEVLEDKFCWASGLGWLKWEGKKWKGCQLSSIKEAIRDYVLDWYNKEVKVGCDSERRKELFALQSAKRVGALTSLMEGLLEEDPEIFDAHPELMNTPSGVIQLPTMELLPHDPNLYMTNITKVAYVPGASHPDWEATQKAISEEARQWVLERLGQAITGDTPPDDVLTVFQGTGANGKSSLLAGVTGALGDYAVKVSDKLLLPDQGQHPTEKMNLRGARFAYIEETAEARYLDVQRLKEIAGTPSITARLMRQNNVTFSATHTFFLATNHMPIISENTHAVWRRLKLVKFPYTFRKNNEILRDEWDKYGDSGLRDRMKTGAKQQEAVLATLVEYASRYYQNNKMMCADSARVDKYTRRWRGETDIIMRYIDERLIMDKQSHILVNELYVDFSIWLENHGHHRWNEQTTTGRFKDHEDFTNSRVRKTRTDDYNPLSRRTFIESENRAVTGKQNIWQGVRFRIIEDE